VVWLTSQSVATLVLGCLAIALLLAGVGFIVLAAGGALTRPDQPT